MKSQPKIMTAFLTAITLVALSSARAAEPTEGLISHWAFDEGHGTTAYDSAGNNDGTVYGAHWTTGQINSALIFDGYADYVRVGDKGSLDFGTSEDFTITTWFKTLTYGAGMLVNKRATGREGGYDLYIDRGMITARASDATRVFYARTTEAFNDGYWHHVAAVYDRTDVINLYVDGHYRSSSEPITLTIDVNNTEPFAIGRRYGGVSPAYFYGSIDEVRVYKRILSAEEVQQLYEDEFSVHGPPTSLEISGPEQMFRNSSAQYKATAYYQDGFAIDVTTFAHWWLQPATLASIDENGILTAGCIGIPPEPQDLSVFAKYTRGQVMVQGQMTVQILPPRTLYVPAQYGNIQAAINAAVCGDTIIVADGTYAGYGNRDIDFLGKAITVRSENGPGSCIIDCQASGRGFYFHSGEGRDSMLDGFTIINGRTYGLRYGGGIACNRTSPTIRNCIMRDNWAENGGGGLCLSDARVSNCIISNNLAEWGGGVWGGTGEIINCVITNNRATRGYGGGICGWQDSSTQITNCVVVNNSASQAGGGIMLTLASASIINSIFWNQGSEVYKDGFSRATVRFSDIEGGYNGEGNISADPRFVDSANGDYHLLAHSPCINAGDPFYSAGPDETDIDGEPRVAAGRVDIGADEFPGEPAMLVELEITGPNEVAEFSSSVQYTATAHFEGGYTADATAGAAWSAQPPNYADIDQAGLLETGRIEPAGHITIYAQYSERGVTLNDEKTVPVSQLTDLEITGQTDIRQNCPEQYNLTAYYANGHIADVTDSALWQVDPDTFAEIDAGLLTIEKIEELHDIVIAAIYTSGGVTLETETAAQAIVPRTLYVPADYQTIQKAIDVAECGDTILVADGTYTGEGNRDIDFLGKAITIKSENGPENCIIDCNANHRDRHYAFDIHSTGLAKPVLDEFTITNGFQIGGVILCRESDPTITNCLITANVAHKSGSAISCEQASPTITNCTISQNEGTAISCWGGSAVVRDSTLSENIGGGIYCMTWQTASTVTITDCNITANQGEGLDSGFGVYCYGTIVAITNSVIANNETFGIYCTESDVTVVNCEIAENRHTGIWVRDGNLRVTDCDITGNSAERLGRGIYFSTEQPDKTLTVNNCLIAGNSATSGGGGIYCEGTMTLNNCLITNNSGGSNGGAIQLEKGGWDIGPRTSTINNCTIAHNTADKGGGIYSYHSDPMITNSIFSQNEAPDGPQIYMAGYHDKLSVSYTDLQGGPNDIYLSDDRVTVEWGLGNIDADPCFAFPGEYHLTPDSPCIDAGDPNYIPEPNETDLGGNARVIDGDEDGTAVVDMGAYEFWPAIEAEMQLTPQTLNCAAKGKYVKAHIVLPEGILAEDIDVNTPAVALPMDVESEYIKVFAKGKGPVTVEIAFDRAAFCAGIGESAEVEVTVTGLLTTGREFYASDTITIKKSEPKPINQAQPARPLRLIVNRKL